MNIVYLSPHFPPRYHFFPANLRRLGVNVLGITDQATWQLDPEVASALSDHIQVGSLSDAGQVFGAVDEFRRRHGPIHRIESHLESWLDLEASLRQHFEVPGLRPGDMGRLKKKSEMKSIFEKSLVSLKDLPEGTVLSREHVGVKKPGTGIPARELEQVLGMRTRRAIPGHTLLSREDLA